MTDQIYDDRARAYVGAREALEAANQVKARWRSVTYDGTPESEARLGDALPADYWSLIAEAAVLAQLARAEAGVGMLAGNYLVDRAERLDRKKRRQLREGVFEKLAEQRKQAEAVTTHDHATEGTGI